MAINQPQSPKITNNGNRDLPIETRAAPITAIDAEARTIEVTWTTGAKVDRFDWMSGQRYVEELVVSDKAIRLDRLNAGGPVLDSHDVYGGLKSLLAVVERAWIEKGEGRAVVRFPKAEDNPEADKVFRLIGDKIIRSLSVGYRRIKIEVDKGKDPQVWRVVDWEPFEISFVAVPADVGAQVRDGKAKMFRCEFRASAPDQNEARRIRMRKRALETAR
jgi:HK97 family phage prohead protease